MKKRMKLAFQGTKCLTCAYYHGLIICIKSPCRECILNKRKVAPFPIIRKTSNTKTGGNSND